MNTNINTNTNTTNIIALSSKDIFYVYHKTSKTMIEKLDWTQFHAICRTITQNDINNYSVWIMNSENWLTLGSIINQVLDSNDGLYRIPPMPPEQVNGEKISHQLMDSPSDKRAHKRYNVRLPLTVDILGELIKTSSLDISHSGMRLEQSIFISANIDHCFVYAHINKVAIEFKAAPIFEPGDQTKISRFHLKSCNQIDLWDAVLQRAEEELQPEG